MESSSVIGNQIPELLRASRSDHGSAVFVKNHDAFGLKQSPQVDCHSSPLQAGFIGTSFSNRPSAELLSSLESVAWSARQRSLIAVVVFAMLAFALYAYVDSGKQLAHQAWMEGRDAGCLKASDPVHEVECPYSEPRMSDAWHAGYREGIRVGFPNPYRSGHQ